MKFFLLMPLVLFISSHAFAGDNVFENAGQTLQTTPAPQTSPVITADKEVTLSNVKKQMALLLTP